MRSQFFSTEMIVVSVLFLFILSLSFNLWRTKNVSFDSDISKFNAEEKGENMLSILLSSPGYPQYWDVNNVKQIGLCDDYHIINSFKLNNFMMLSNNNYSFVTDLFGIKDYGFEVSYLNGTKLYKFNTNIDSDKIVSLKSIAVLNDTKVIFNLLVVE